MPTEESILNQFEDPESYLIKINDPRNHKVGLKTVRDLQFGSQQFKDQVEQLENAAKKAEGFVDSVIHNCKIKHFSKQMITEEALEIIDDICPCVETPRLAKAKVPLFLHVCPNNHPNWKPTSYHVMKSCKTCTAIRNTQFHKQSPEQIAALEKKEKENETHNKLLKEVEEKKLDKEIEKQAMILARSRVLEKQILKEMEKK